VFGPSDDGREDGARSVISGKSGFAHSGAVINDEGSCFFIHCWERGKMGEKDGGMGEGVGLANVKALKERGENTNNLSMDLSNRHYFATFLRR
jgi:hypothetical protein